MKDVLPVLDVGESGVVCGSPAPSDALYYVDVCVLFLCVKYHIMFEFIEISYCLFIFISCLFSFFLCLLFLFIFIFDYSGSSQRFIRGVCQRIAVHYSLRRL